MFLYWIYFVYNPFINKGIVLQNFTLKKTQVETLIDDSLTLSSIANINGFIFNEFNDINWVGFYFWSQKLNKLVLGPFCGKVACTTIDYGKGVCGTSLQKKEVLVVNDVHLFDGHIACDTASRSEVVIPLYIGDTKIGVLDIDSPIVGRFDKESVLFFKHTAEVLVNKCGKELKQLISIL